MGEGDRLTGITGSIVRKRGGVGRGERGWGKVEPRKRYCGGGRRGRLQRALPLDATQHRFLTSLYLSEIDHLGRTANEPGARSKAQKRLLS